MWGLRSNQPYIRTLRVLLVQRVQVRQAVEPREERIVEIEIAPQPKRWQFVAVRYHQEIPFRTVPRSLRLILPPALDRLQREALRAQRLLQLDRIRRKPNLGVECPVREHQSPHGDQSPGQKWVLPGISGVVVTRRPLKEHEPSA